MLLHAFYDQCITAFGNMRAAKVCLNSVTIALMSSMLLYGNSLHTF